MNIVQGLGDFQALSIGDKFIVALPTSGWGSFKASLRVEHTG